MRARFIFFVDGILYLSYANSTTEAANKVFEDCGYESDHIDYFGSSLDSWKFNKNRIVKNGWDGWDDYVEDLSHMLNAKEIRSI